MTPTPARQTVLVIDDEVQIRRLLRITLDAAGYSVLEADTGRYGLDEAVRRQPDAIILDLGLPDLGGLEVLRQLREWTRVPGEGGRPGRGGRRLPHQALWRRRADGQAAGDPAARAG
jgi:CheY-like chemotaxis protein